MSRQNLLPLLADRFLNTPLLIDPAKAATIYGVLSGRIGADVPLDFESVDAAPVEFEVSTGGPTPQATRFRGSHRTADGGYTDLRREGSVAMIEVTGSLVNRGAWVGASSGLTSYEGIGAMADKARLDPSIKAVILDINSPGGEATGMFALAGKIRALSAVKPVVAVVNDVAASAAYGIASAATEIVISPTSFVGSIGVVMVHMDHSGEMEKKGVKSTIFQGGRHKTDGHPFGPLSGDVKASLQMKVDTLYESFVEAVAEGRGARLDAAAAYKTEAEIFIGAKAIELGLADRMGTFDAVLDELKTNARSGTTTENVKMANENNGPKTEGANITQAQSDSAAVDARAAGVAEGQKAATARIGSILNSEAGLANPKLAAHFAFKTEMSAESANEALVAAGPAAASDVNKIPTPDQRAEGGENEFGADDERKTPSAEGEDVWKTTVAEQNRRFE